MATSASDEAFETASRDYGATQRVVRWWLAGLGYALYCIFGRFLPEDIDNGFLIFLNRHGAVLAAVICAVGAACAYREQRRQGRRFHEVAQAWAAGRVATRKPSASK
jgi:hypothetical protein